MTGIEVRVVQNRIVLHNEPKPISDGVDCTASDGLKGTVLFIFFDIAFLWPKTWIMMLFTRFCLTQYCHNHDLIFDFSPLYYEEPCAKLEGRAKSKVSVAKVPFFMSSNTQPVLLP